MKRAADNGSVLVEEQGPAVPGPRRSLERRKWQHMAVDVLVVSLGATAGLRRADDELAASMRRAGASVALVRAHRPRELPTMALGDLAYARNARLAAAVGIAAHAPRAVLYSTTTAASLWPRPGAIRFDAPSSGNRPGRHGAWQRPVERRRLGEASLLLPVERGRARRGGGAPRPGGGRAGARRALGRAGPRNATSRPSPTAPTRTRRASIVCSPRGAPCGGPRRRSWSRASPAGATASRATARASSTGACSGPGEYRSLLRRARLYVTAPRREDYGLAQLEALADGCVLVTAPARGPYAAAPSLASWTKGR